MSSDATQSVIQQFMELPAERRKAFLATLNDSQLLRIKYNWELNARPKQLPPGGDWRHWLILSGRGFGKTRTGAEWILSRAREYPGEPILIVGQTKADVENTMIENEPSSLFNIAPPWFTPRYKEGGNKRIVIFPNGTQAKLFYGDKPDQMRGQNSHTLWLDEFAKFQYPEQLWKESLNLGLRIGPDPKALFTSTPRPIKILRELVSHPKSVVVTGSSYENIANLNDTFRDELMHTYEGTRLGRQELYGEILDDHPGALWSYTMLDEMRLPIQPELDLIVIGVDPSVGDDDGSDECGIVIAGRCTDRLMDKDHYATIADLSGQYHTLEWPRQVVAAYHKYNADVVVIETNQGGGLNKNVIHAIDDSIKIVTNADIDGGKWWNKSKEARASPVAMIMEQGRDHHVGTFAQLEDELCTWEPDKKMPSPNRLDAKVWAYLYMDKKQSRYFSTWSN